MDHLEDFEGPATHYYFYYRSDSLAAIVKNKVVK